MPNLQHRDAACGLCTTTVSDHQDQPHLTASHCPTGAHPPNPRPSQSHAAAGPTRTHPPTPPVRCWPALCPAAAAAASLDLVAAPWPLLLQLLERWGLEAGTPPPPGCFLRAVLLAWPQLLLVQAQPCWPQVQSLQGAPPWDTPLLCAC